MRRRSCDFRGYLRLSVRHELQGCDWNIMADPTAYRCRDSSLLFPWCALDWPISFGRLCTCSWSAARGTEGLEKETSGVGEVSWVNLSRQRELADESCERIVISRRP